MYNKTNKQLYLFFVISSAWVFKTSVTTTDNSPFHERPQLDNYCTIFIISNDKNCDWYIWLISLEKKEKKPNG